MPHPVPERSRQARLVRFFAFVGCALPAIFALECLLLVLAIPTFRAMFADFGTKLPVLTEWVFDWCVAIAGLAIAAVAIPAVRYWDTGLSREHVVVACVLGLFNFMLAQATLVSLFLPIFTLSAVSGGL